MDLKWLGENCKEGGRTSRGKGGWHWPAGEKAVGNPE